MPKLTVPAIRARKATTAPQGSVDPLVMVTAYDAPTARIVDAGGADLILVGDSVAMVVLGHEDTLSVTVEEIAHHVAAVARAKPNALIVADLPWLSYHVSVEDTVRNAAQLIRAGAQAVKLEGGAKRVTMIEALVDAEIPVMGHVGLTPQSVNAMGGFRVQGRQVDGALAVVEDAKAVAAAGCFAVVLEGVPDVVGKLCTEAIPVPTIGIGAGVDCDGQVLVLHDLLGLGAPGRKPPTFVRTYADLHGDATAAVAAFATDVRTKAFPSASEAYHLHPEVAEALGIALDQPVAGSAGEEAVSLYG